MSPYYSCIHLPVFPSQRSGYSSLSGALSPSPPQFKQSSRYRVPQSMAKTTGRPISRPVFFDYNGDFHQGVFIADFSTRSANALIGMIAGSNDFPLANTCVKEINLCIKVRTLCTITKSICDVPLLLSGRVTNIWTGRSVLLRVPR